MAGRMEHIMTIAKLDHPYKLTAARAAWTAWQTAKTRAEYIAKGYYTDAQRAAAAADAETKRAAYHVACADLRAIIDAAEGHAKVRCMTVADIMHAIDGVPGVIKKSTCPAVRSSRMTHPRRLSRARTSMSRSPRSAASSAARRGGI